MSMQPISHNDDQSSLLKQEYQLSADFEQAARECKEALGLLQESMDMFKNTLKRSLDVGFAHLLEVFNEQLSTIERRLPPEAPQA